MHSVTPSVTFTRMYSKMLVSYDLLVGTIWIRSVMMSHSQEMRQVMLP